MGCKIANQGCKSITQIPRTTCTVCGEPVCTSISCSKRIYYHGYKIQRLCLNCVEEMARHGETWALITLRVWHQKILEAGYGGWPVEYLAEIQKAHDTRCQRRSA